MKCADCEVKFNIYHCVTVDTVDIIGVFGSLETPTVHGKGVWVCVLFPFTQEAYNPPEH